MNILLINQNPIVSKVFSLGIQTLTPLQVDEISTKSKNNSKNYDIVVIDDGCCLSEEIEELFRTIHANKKIFLSAKTDSKIIGYDQLIRKPFVPSQIMDIFQDAQKTPFLQNNILQNTTSTTLQEISKDQTNASSLVLNDGEIDTIKQLLEENETLLDDLVPNSPIETTTQMQDMLAENFATIIGNMQPQELKELLAGAQIKIKITFPKEA